MDFIEAVTFCERQLAILGSIQNELQFINIKKVFEDIHIEDDEEALLLQIQNANITEQTDNPAFNAAVGWLVSGNAVRGKTAVEVLTETLMEHNPDFKQRVEKYVADHKAE